MTANVLTVEQSVNPVRVETTELVQVLETRYTLVVNPDNWISPGTGGGGEGEPWTLEDGTTPWTLEDGTTPWETEG